MGKSTFTEHLTQKHSFALVSSSGILKDIASKKGLPVERKTLQDLGDKLDNETCYRWVSDAFLQKLNHNEHNLYWIFDSIRKNQQKENFLRLFPNNSLHVHLTAPDNILAERYNNRKENQQNSQDKIPYEIAKNHTNEQEARSLFDQADLIYDTEKQEINSIVMDVIKNLEAMKCPK